MQDILYKFFDHHLCVSLASLVLLGYSTDSPAWAKDGHNAIGILALNQLSADVRGQLENITGPMDEQTIFEACNWPDAVRETDEWEWSKPLHYVNIPRGDFTYLESRDCPDQLCATQAIKRYADELANPDMGEQERQQAFAWLCHLVGDLHQPMHGGFADDRGGNDFEVMVRHEKMNLHRYWDFEIINHHAGGWKNLVEQLQAIPPGAMASDWSAKSVNDWTDESHQLAKEKAYPASGEIDESFEQQSWGIVQRRLIAAAERLASIINSILQNGN
jgi:hypothetical protein